MTFWGTAFQAFDPNGKLGGGITRIDSSTEDRRSQYLLMILYRANEDLVHKVFLRGDDS